MGIETVYSVVMVGLGCLGLAMTAKIAALAPGAGERLHLANLVMDILGTARQQAAFTASQQEAARHLQRRLMKGQRLASGFRGRKLRTPKSPTPSEPPAPSPT